MPNWRRRDYRETTGKAWKIYRQQSLSQQIFLLAQGISLILFAAMFFYRSIVAALILLPLLFPIYKRQKRIAIEKKRKTLTIQFKDLMESVMTSLKAGYSAENAFGEAYREMAFLHGKHSAICKELFRIESGLRNNIPLEKLLLRLASDSGVEEIREFAEVFAIAKRSGGNMIEIMERTVNLISSRLEVEKEIDLILSAKKMEQKIMDVVPFLIIAYIGFSSQGFFDVLYHNPVGILIMSVCLAVYIAAFMLSEKIIQISV